MTDNEYAATLLGWKPTDPATPAPDMSNPHKYMAALTTLHATEIVFQTYDGLNICIFLTKFREKLGQAPDAYGFDEFDWGNAVVMALAQIAKKRLA